jgi:RNA polymerase sigma-70 factor (ECF subfamily)
MSLEALSDREIFALAQTGDRAAFSVWMRRHEPRVFRLVKQLVRRDAEAEEVAQETFVRAFRALPTFDGRSEPFTWLYRIALNLSLNVLRSRRAAHDDVDDPRHANSAALSAPGSEADLEQRQLVNALYSGLDELSESLRVTLLLVCVDGVSHEAASQILGVPEGTVAWRVHEARRKLKLILEERGFALSDRTADRKERPR